MSNSGKQHRPRNRRAANPPPMRLTARDRQVIQAVHDFRVLRQDQIQTLFFGSRQTAQFRLQKLYHNGYLDRRFLPVVGGAASSPTLYVLDERGADLLRAELGRSDIRPPQKDKRLGVKYLEHTTDINTFRIAVTLAAGAHDFQIEVWHDDQRLSQDYDRVQVPGSGKRTRGVPVVPDSYFALTTPKGRSHFFLELDRATMELGRFQTKVLAYLHYYTSGGYQRRYGTRSLRVLTVTIGNRRLNNLKKTTENAGGHAPFYFTTLAQVTPETVLHEPIWKVAGNQQNHALIE